MHTFLKKKSIKSHIRTTNKYNWLSLKGKTKDLQPFACKDVNTRLFANLSFQRGANEVSGNNSFKFHNIQKPSSSQRHAKSNQQLPIKWLIQFTTVQKHLKLLQETVNVYCWRSETSPYQQKFTPFRRQPTGSVSPPSTSHPQSFTSRAEAAQRVKMLDWRGLFCPSQQNSRMTGLLVSVCSFKSQIFSVIDSQPEELQQLLVVRLNEVSRLLPAVVLQLRVGSQREEVAGRNTIWPCLLKRGQILPVCHVGELNASFCHTLVSGRSRGCKNAADPPASLTVCGVGEPWIRCVCACVGMCMQMCKQHVMSAASYWLHLERIQKYQQQHQLCFPNV